MPDMRTLKYICIIILWTFFCVWPLSGKPLCKTQIINTNKVSITVHMEIADTQRLREKGLMDRKNMPWNQGMLFVFETSQLQRFWMKNTSIPLSIAFIDKNGTINEIYDMKPLDTTITSSHLPARYALEVNQGWFLKNNITRGSRILFNGCVGK